MNTPKISIVTASLNALDGLRQTVGSVESQTYEDFEHIVVDGGSTDGSRQYLSTQNKVRWISEPDQGIADALNKAIDLASGEWILVLHAEDTFLQSHSLDHAARFLREGSEIVSFDVLFSEQSGAKVRRSHGFCYWTNFKTTVPHQGAFCRRSLFERIGSFDPRFKVAMDYEFFLRAYRAGVQVEVVRTVLSRMPNSGISSRTDWGALRARFAEERLAHSLHISRKAPRAIYRVYWPAYLAYRRARSMVSRV